MKKIITAIGVMFAALVFIGAVPVMAASGGMGFFGGITEGVRLPKTTELMLASTAKRNTNAATVMQYKEIVFLSGVSYEFEGQITIRQNGTVSDTADVGSYRVTYTVAPNAATSEDVSINRNITFTVNYRKSGSQLVLDYAVTSWTETVTAGGNSYALDSRLSHFDVSILEDITAGVTYYKGDLSMKAVYFMGDAMTTLESYGTLYGYSCAWSNTEVQRLNCNIYTDEWQLQYQIRPSVSVNKVLQYSVNEPNAISFRGNYREVMQNQSGLAYDIYVLPNRFYGTPLYGSASIDTVNAFEQLTTKDTSIISPHWAEEDISKLFAMDILEGEPRFFMPDQAITRGQFASLLVKAIKLPVEDPPAPKGKKITHNIVFPDVMDDRPDYPYIMALYNAGLTVGRGSGLFYPDEPIEFEEAMVLLVRALGLTNLGIEPSVMTLYADDAEISDWAKKEIYAGTRIGLIFPDLEGKINPHAYLTKAAGAALINHLIEYMRESLTVDYTAHIVPYAD